MWKKQLKTQKLNILCINVFIFLLHTGFHQKTVFSRATVLVNLSTNKNFRPCAGLDAMFVNIIGTS